MPALVTAFLLLVPLGKCSAESLSLDTALRTVTTAADFSDYLSVASNTYASDISKAVELGLVVGKYDSNSTYFDPNALVTTGEMVNILARNLGATSTTQGAAAVTYLSNLGVSVGGQMDTALPVWELQSLATQIASLDVAARADLVVLREALSGGFADSTKGITRAYAVAMYTAPAQQPAAFPSPANTTALSDPAVPPPQSNSGSSGKTTHSTSPTRVNPVFVLTH